MPKRGSLVAAGKQLRKTHAKQQSVQRQQQRHQRSRQQANAAHRKATAKCPYEHWMRVLLVGEGNFSFAAALAARFGGNAARLTATCLDSEPLLHQKYADAADRIAQVEAAGGTVLYEVDATQLGEHAALVRHARSLRGEESAAAGLAPAAADGTFDRIVFNFPHAGAGIKDEQRNVALHRALLLNFVPAALKLLAPRTGQLHLTVKKGKPYDQWEVTKTVLAAAKGVLKLHSAPDFWPHLYEGYRHRRTLGYSEALSFDENEDIIAGAKTYVFTWLDAPDSRARFEKKQRAAGAKGNDSDDDNPEGPTAGTTIEWSDDEHERERRPAVAAAAPIRPVSKAPIVEDDIFADSEDEAVDVRSRMKAEAEDENEGEEGEDDDDIDEEAGSDVDDEEMELDVTDAASAKTSKTSAAVAAAAAAAAQAAKKQQQKKQKLSTSALGSLGRGGVNLFFGLEQKGDAFQRDREELEKTLAGMASDDDDSEAESGEDIEVPKDDEQQRGKGKSVLGKRPLPGADKAKGKDKPKGKGKGKDKDKGKPKEKGNKAQKLAVSNRAKRKAVTKELSQTVGGAAAAAARKVAAQYKAKKLAAAAAAAEKAGSSSAPSPAKKQKTQHGK